MKCLPCLLLFLLLGATPHWVVAQGDTAQVNRLLELCYGWQYRQPDSTLQVAPKAIEQAAKLGYSFGEARAWYYLGHAQYELHAYDSAISALRRAIALFDDQKDAARKAAAYNIKGICQKNLADYTRALHSQLNAITLFEKVSDTAGIIISYNNLGILYNDQDKLPDAETYLWKALKLAEIFGDEYLLVTTRSNIGLNYHSQKRYREALDVFAQVLKFDVEDGNAYEISTSYNNLASSYLKLQVLDSALMLLDSALVYKRLSGDKFGQIIAYANMAEAYDSLKKYRTTLHYLDSALQMAHEIGASRLRKDIYEKYYHAYRQLGITDSALFYYKAFAELKDSLHNQDTEVALANVQRQFDLEKIDQELREANLALENIRTTQKLYFIGFISILLLSIVLGFGFFRIRRLNNKLNRKQDELENTNHILQRVNQQLEFSRAEADSANKAKSAFLSNVSHEIRTPLNAILGLLDLMRESLQEKQQTNTIETIQHSANSLLHIINDLLDLSKIEAGRIDFQSKSFSFTALMAQVENTLKALAGEKALSVSTEIDPKIPVYLQGDQFRLNQILLNLGGNAIKFTADGGVVLRVQCASENPEHCLLRFEVQDTGIGIPAHQMESIFDRFSQADEHISRKFGGTGLGLSICKKLVELQGGKIGVESAVNVGSTFWFELDFEVPLTQHSISKTLENDSGEWFEGKKVLIIDDNQLNLKLARQIVQRWKMAPVLADSGRQALEHLAEDNSFDLVLLDIHMPEMNGFETYAAMKSLGLVAPVIALTADTYEETRQAIFQAGIDSIVLKPYTAAELKKAVLPLLNP